MPKAQDYHLTEQELTTVETAIRRDKRPEVQQRYIAINLLHLGNKPVQIAEMQAVSKPTIYGWYDRWCSGGVEGLANKPKSGRPPKADDEYTAALQEVIEKEPSELGYDFVSWTIDRLRAHLEKKTGISLSENRFRALLKRKGYRYRRPKYDLSHLQDKDAKAKASELLKELKKSPRRRLRTHLCGRNDHNPGSAAASVLDKAWTTKAYFSDSPGCKAEATCLWRPSLVGRHHHLYDCCDEEQPYFHQLLGRTAGEAGSEKVCSFGDG